MSTIALFKRVCNEKKATLSHGYDWETGSANLDVDILLLEIGFSLVFPAI